MNYPKAIFHYPKNCETGVNPGQKIWKKYMLLAIIK